MSNPHIETSGSRATFRGNPTREEIVELAANPQISVLQTSEPADDYTWDLINNELINLRPDIMLRVYGFYGEVCDLKFVRRLTNARRFSADCIQEATGVENLAYLRQPIELQIGIYCIESFDALADIDASSLESLSLEATNSKRPSLHHLPRFSGLKALYLEGQQKEIEGITALKQLEDLTLRSISQIDLGLLQCFTHLWSLDIKLGGNSDLSGINGILSLKYLELWQVRGLANLDIVSTLTELQFLFLQSLPNVTQLPDFARLTQLRRVYLENMKGLKDFSPLLTAPTLEEFYHCDARGMKPDDYAGVLKIPTLKRAGAGLGSISKNNEFRAMAAQLGVSEYRSGSFEFR